MDDRLHRSAGERSCAGWWVDPDVAVRELHPRLVGYFGFLGYPGQDAEDLAQETLVRLLDHWDRAVGARSPDAWVFRTARNVSNSWLRRLRLVRRRDQGQLLRHHDDGDRADVVAVRQAVAALPARQREAVVLRHFQCLPVNETAEAMGCAEGTVRALTSQGLAALRVSLAPSHGEQQGEER